MNIKNFADRKTRRQALTKVWDLSDRQLTQYANTIFRINRHRRKRKEKTSIGIEILCRQRRAKANTTVNLASVCSKTQ